MEIQVAIAFSSVGPVGKFDDCAAGRGIESCLDGWKISRSVRVDTDNGAVVWRGRPVVIAGGFCWPA
jgi:hypothetical protein